MANKNDYSLVFNGTSSDATITGYKVPVASFSFAFWYKPVSVTTNDRPVDQQDGGPQNGFTFVHQTTGDPNIQFVIRNVGTTVAGITSTNMTMGVWHFIVGTYKVNEVKLYVNGIIQGTADFNATMTDSTAVVVLGRRSASTSNYANGLMTGVQIYNRVLSGSETRKLYTDKGMLPGCILRLRMDDGSGSVTNDTSGSGKNAALTNTSWSTDIPYTLGQRNSPEGPRVNMSLRPSTYVIFDGVDDYIDLGSVSIIPDATAAMTATAWILNTGKGDNINGIIGNQRDGTTVGWNFKISSAAKSKLEFTFYTASSSLRGWIGNVNIPLYRWCHVGVTFDGSTARFYIDGTEDEKETLTTPVTIKVGTDTIRIGQRTAGGEFFKGNIAKVALWTRALSSSEIRSIYLSDSYSSTNLAGWWKLDEGSGTNAVDSSSGNHNGTLTAGPTWGIL